MSHRGYAEGGAGDRSGLPPLPSALLHRCASQHKGSPCPPCGNGCIQSKLDPRYPNSWSFTYLCQNPAQMVVHTTPNIPIEDPFQNFDIQSLFTDDIAKASKDKLIFSPDPILLDEQSKLDLAKHLESLAHDADLQNQTLTAPSSSPLPQLPFTEILPPPLPYQQHYNYIHNPQYSDVSEDSFPISGYPSTSTLLPEIDLPFRPSRTSTPIRSHSHRERHPTEDQVTITKVHRRSLP